jgi:hypothetical protein
LIDLSSYVCERIFACHPTLSQVVPPTVGLPIFQLWRANPKSNFRGWRQWHPEGVKLTMSFHGLSGIQPVSKDQVLLNEKAGKYAKCKQGTSESPGQFFNEIDGAGRPKHLVSALATKCTVHTTSFRVLDEDHEDQKDTNKGNENGDKLEHVDFEILL